MAKDEKAPEQAKEDHKPTHPSESPDKVAKPSTEGFVKVKNGDEVRHVHPDTLKAHKAAGWTQV